MKSHPPEFSRVLSVARIPPKGVEETLQAKPVERTALAKRFDLIDIPRLEAHLTLKPESDDAIHVTGDINAEIVQQCIVSLEPITNNLNIGVDLLLIPGKKKNDEPEDFSGDMNAEIDTYTNGKIDLGELVVQQLGVNIDLYPRKPNAALGISEFGPKAEENRPFARLSDTVKVKKNNKEQEN